MAVEPVRVYEINTNATSDLLNNEICNESINDSDLGFPMWGGKDNSGNVTKWLAKDKNARVNALTVQSFSSSGYVKNDANGVISGGNTISIEEIPDRYWYRNNALGYIYPQTLTDKVGINVSVPLADLDVRGTFRLLTQAGGNVDEISNDGTFAASADDQLATALAIKTYVDAQVSVGGSKWTRTDSTLGYYTVYPNTAIDRVLVGSLTDDLDIGMFQIWQQSSNSNQGVGIYDDDSGLTAQLYINSSGAFNIRMDYSYVCLGLTDIGDFYIQNGVSVNNITNDTDMAPINAVTLATTYAIDSYVSQAVRWDYSGSNIFPKNRDTTTVSIGKSVYSDYVLNLHSDTGICLRLSGNTTTPRQGGTLGFGGSPTYNYVKELTEDNLVIGYYSSTKLFCTNGSLNSLTVNSSGNVLFRNGTDVNNISTNTSLASATDYMLSTTLAIKTYVDAQTSGGGYWDRNSTNSYIIPTNRLTDEVMLDDNSTLLGVYSHLLNISSSTGECLRLCGASTASGGRINFGDSNIVYIEEPQGADDTIRIKSPKIHLSRSTGSAIANYSDALLISSVGGYNAIGVGYDINDSYYSGARFYVTTNSSGYANILKLHNRSTGSSAGAYMSFYTNTGGSTNSSGTERMKVGYYTSSNVQSAGLEYDGYYFSLYCNENNTRPLKTNGHKFRVGDYANLPTDINGPFEIDGFPTYGICMDNIGTVGAIGTIDYSIQCRIGSGGSFIQDGGGDETFYIPIYAYAT